MFSNVKVYINDVIFRTQISRKKVYIPPEKILIKNYQMRYHLGLKHLMAVVNVDYYCKFASFFVVNHFHYRHLLVNHYHFLSTFPMCMKDLTKNI